MNYLAGILGVALIGAVTTAAIFRGNAAEWQTKYTTLQASYAQTAQKAKDDAAAQVAADKAENQRRADSAISQALQGQKQAETALQSYLARGNAASRGKVDMGHECFSVPIPADMVPK